MSVVIHAVYFVQVVVLLQIILSFLGFLASVNMINILAKIWQVIYLKQLLILYLSLHKTSLEKCRKIAKFFFLICLCWLEIAMEIHFSSEKKLLIWC